MIKWEEQLRTMTGFQNFKPGQEDALNKLSAGENTLAILATSGGKSLIYQLFQYQEPGLTVIVSPLIALMQDQVRQSQALGIQKVASLNSQQDTRERAWLLNRLGDLQFLFLSPETLLQDKILRRLKEVPIRLLVVDEAHCISQWGFDFRPEYADLLKARKHLGLPLTLALSATADQEIIADIQQLLFTEDENLAFVASDTNRPNIFYGRDYVESKDKLSYLVAALENLPKPGIVYVHHKEELEKLLGQLRQQTSLNLESYHGDRSDADRQLIQGQFLAGQVDVILATSAFGMGINQDNVRFVIHYHFPQSLEELIQEDGRAGRDGKQALALWLVDSQEISRLNHLQQIQTRSYQENQQLLDALFQLKQTRTQQAIDTMLAKLPENQAALLTFYHRHYSNYQAALTHLTYNYQRKQEKLGQVVSLLESDDCFRLQLLKSSQNQVKEYGQVPCCSNCQKNYKDQDWYQTYLNMGRQNSKAKSSYDWQKHLQALLG
ncbi:RecQ family ATP-dependent DNA helicase [Aerococcus kribbianus]|uniref:RecQ family ATP-dependent DNA helicase n=1 Tax=Aerococcus kribbianus TaxID=2999064 RepID=A0A9X3FN84_9LACT|nr:MULTISPECIES: RecQ family ATP-dependent DNA helicase [unclassified Aerococcus]MCZ0717657.1 RecQ family ATP-dependent DNA helicase [Aerococcus sp. YH-aer221]MCZ0725945.1 RecQ family ATP-dependent DNA helicase [Aerococcus sp. YH-aer222]